jgi:hypothetical protein
LIKRQLTMIYDKGIPGDTDLNTICFNTWKDLHMHLFENGLYSDFHVFDNGKPVLHYWCGVEYNYNLKWDSSVPGSVLFEIVNRHASAQLN